MELFKNLYIFEMANNHQGQPEHGEAIILEMGKIVKKHGIKAAVKFQYRNLDTFIHPDFRNDTKAKHISRFLSTELSAKQFLHLVEITRNQELVTVCTPFDEVSVDLIVDHGIDIIKIASCSADDWPLLEKIASANKPIIASTGGLDLSQIDNLVSFFTNKGSDFAILHCVGIYPTPDESLHLKFIAKLKKRYPDRVIGYSGHEAPENYEVVKLAIAEGAEILERHVGVPTDTISLNKYSMNPDQTDQWVEASLRARTILGEDIKILEDSEKESLLSLKRGVFAKQDLKHGQLINESDVYFAMPCKQGQLTSGEFGQYRVQIKASKTYKANQAIFEKTTIDTLSKTRDVIHKVKGIINEAGIPLGEGYEVELSHHFGMDRFGSIGCTIISMVNRDYCKKLIIVLSGQENPEHMHKIKEETFQLLWGDLTVMLDGQELKLKPGDMKLVKRNTWHSFKSNQGAVFEEVSTTHRRGDSFYKDHEISELDPMQRKTILDEW